MRAEKLKLTEHDLALQLPVPTPDESVQEQGNAAQQQIEPEPPMPNALSKPAKPATRAWWFYLAAIGLTYACVHGGANLSALGMDWGYFTIGQFIPQPDDNQWLGAGYLTVLAAPAIYAAMAISILKGALGGNWRWRLLLLPMLMLGLCISGHPPSWSDCVDMSPYILGVWLFSLWLSLGFDHVYRELAQRVKATRLLMTLLMAVLPAALLPIDDHGLAGTHNILLEITVYCGLLFAAAFLAPLSIRTCKQSAAFAALLFASLPVLTFNLFNVVFATVCSAAGKPIGMEIGWQAPASAMLILLASTVVAVGGAALGALAARLRYWWGVAGRDHRC